MPNVKFVFPALCLPPKIVSNARASSRCADSRSRGVPARGRRPWALRLHGQASLWPLWEHPARRGPPLSRFRPPRGLGQSVPLPADRRAGGQWPRALAGDWRVHCVNEAVNERPPAGLLEFAEPFQSIAYGDRIHSHAGDGEILNRPEDGLVRRPVEILSPEALGIPGPPWCRQEEAAQDGDLGVVVEGERYPYLRGHGPYSSS